MVQNWEKLKLSPFTFWRNITIFGTVFKVNFDENFTSNEAQTQPKTGFKAGISCFSPFFKISKMVQNRQTIMANPLFSPENFKLKLVRSKPKVFLCAN